MPLRHNQLATTCRLAASCLLPSSGFQLGYAPDSWDWLLRQASAAGISSEHLSQAGLAVERQDRGGSIGSGHYDRFRARILFPIRDPLARCVAFGGRILPGSTPDAAKYINSPETAALL